MLIGHTGHTRVIERIVAVPLLILAAWVVIPHPTAIYMGVWLKLVLSGLLSWPGIWLLAAKRLQGRKRALVGVIITYIYTAAIGVVIDPMRLPAACGWLCLAAVAGYLYLVTAMEVKWTQNGLSRPSRAEPGSSGTRGSG